MKIPFLFILFFALLTKSNGDELKNGTQDSYESEESNAEGTVGVNDQNLELNQILDEKLETYPSHKLLPKYSEQPVHVDVDIRIREILDISEVDMDMKLNLVLSVAWKDEALSYENFFPTAKNPGVWVGDSVINKIWTPPVSILNEKASAQQSPNNGYKLGSLLWKPDGSLVRRINILTTVSCSMSVENFPMDEQTCSVLIGSLAHSDHSMELSVKPSLDPIFTRSVKNLELLGLRVSPVVQSNSLDNQTIYSYELLLRRNVGYYVIRTYFPSALLVVLSWIVFWMARDATVGRMALGVTCVLGITTLWISSQSSSPKVSCVKAIDVYLGACFILAFASLLQSHTVGYLLRKVRRQDGKVEETAGRNLLPGEIVVETNQPPHPLDSAFLRVISGRLEATEQGKVAQLVRNFDVWSRMIFPFVFLTFNVAYWTCYLTGSKFDEDEGWKLI